MQLLDSLDAKILIALNRDPEASVLSLSRLLGVARNTVHARVRRMTRDGSLGPYCQRLRPAALGLPLIAFVSIAISQAASGQAIAALERIPEIVELHATTGDADLLAKVVSRDPADLLRVTNAMLAIDGVMRTSTTMSLAEIMPARTLPLLERSAASS